VDATRGSRVDGHRRRVPALSGWPRDGGGVAAATFSLPVDGADRKSVPHSIGDVTGLRPPAQEMSTALPALARKPLQTHAPPIPPVSTPVACHSHLTLLMRGSSAAVAF